MEFEELVALVSDEPVFETGLLLVGNVDPDYVRVQLSRWVKAGRLYRLRRGLYALAPPFQKIRPHPFLVANRLVRGSYVSLQSALAHYGLIPEHVPLTTSVSTMRPSHWDTPLGAFVFRHIKADLFWGYGRLDLGGGQHAFVASPEKALLDLIYLQADADTSAYLHELRLQRLECLDLDLLAQQAKRARCPKLQRAVEALVDVVSEAKYEEL